MKSRILTLIACLFVTSMGFSQIAIKNDGAIIKVEAGATLHVEGGIENTATGTIENDGTINVEGDFINNGTFDATDPNTVIFSGPTHSNVTSGTAIFDNVKIEKDAGQNVILTDPMEIKTNLDFNSTDGKVSLGANDLTLQSTATLTGASGTEYAMTGGAGSLVKEGLSGTFDFPVGFDATTYNPATLNVTAGTDDFSVRAYDTPTDGDGETGTAYTEGVVGAGWEISDNAGGATTDVTLKWATAHELASFDRTMSAVAKNDGAGWDLLAADLAAAGGADPLWTQTRTGVTTFSNFSVGADPLANKLSLTLDLWLEGPWNGTDMDDDLISTQLASFPLAEPHTGYGYIQKAFGGGETTTGTILTTNNVIDWVLVELRSTTSDIVATKSGLLMNNGMVINPDGTLPMTIEGMPEGNYYVVVKHKNSLAVMTDAVVNFAGGSAAVSFKGNVGVEGGAAAQQELSAGVFGLYQADLDGSGTVDAADRSAAWNDRNASGYERSDANLSGTVEAADRSAAWNNRNKSTAVPAGN